VDAIVYVLTNYTRAFHRALMKKKAANAQVMDEKRRDAQAAVRQTLLFFRSFSFHFFTDGSDARSDC
jgi:hypothetical protein